MTPEFPPKRRATLLLGLFAFLSAEVSFASERRCGELRTPEDCQKNQCTWRHDRCFIAPPINSAVHVSSKKLQSWVQHAKKTSGRAPQNKVVLFVHSDGSVLWSRRDQTSAYAYRLSYFDSRGAKVHMTLPTDLEIEDPKQLRAQRSSVSQMERAIRADYMREGYKPINRRPKGLRLSARVEKNTLRIQLSRGTAHATHALDRKTLFPSSPTAHFHKSPRCGAVRLLKGVDLGPRTIILIDVPVVGDIDDANAAFAAMNGSGGCSRMTALLSLSRDLSILTP